MVDTRLQNGLLLDPKLQRRLTAEEFRSYINLTVFAVAQISDGVFQLEDAEMVMDVDHIQKFLANDLVEKCEEEGTFRIHPDYWQWQSSKAQLDALSAKRKADAERKRQARQRPDIPPPPEPMEPEAPWGRQ